MNKHPNATVATGTGIATTAILWVAGREHWSLPEWEASGIATAAIAVALFVGRNGVLGIWDRFLHGAQPPPR